MNQIRPVKILTVHGRTTGWLVSLLLHGGVLLASVNAFNTLTIVPANTELFSWDVSIVEAPQQQAAAEPAESHVDTSKASPAQPKSTPPTPVQTATPSPTPVTREVETTPVVEPVEREILEVVHIAPATRQVVEVETNPIVSQTTPEQVPVETIMDTKPVTEQPSVTTEVVTKREEVVAEKSVEPTVVAKAETSVAHQPAVQESAPSTVAHAPVPAASHIEAAKVDTETPSRAALEETPVSHAAVHPSPVETKQPTSAARETNAQVARAPRSGPATKADYGWLAESLWKKVAELKRYPHQARLNRWEGKVVLKAVIKDDGHLGDIRIQESSGFDILDQDALELVRQACPLHLKHPLGRPDIAIQIPINYALR